MHKLHNFGAKIELLSGHAGQNMAWAWVQFAAKLFQSLNILITNVSRTLEGNSTCHSHPMTPVSVQRTPKFGIKWQLSGLIVPKLSVSVSLDYCKSISKSQLTYEECLWSLEWYLQITLSCKRTVFRENGAQMGQFWCKNWADGWLLWSK